MQCERCGSVQHLTMVSTTTSHAANSADFRTQACPSIWRMYTYVSDEIRRKNLARRLEAANIEITADGGERYIATDIWCYNCGLEGHMGDVCI